MNYYIKHIIEGFDFNSASKKKTHEIVGNKLTTLF
jgi:hypothetical protein